MGVLALEKVSCAYEKMARRLFGGITIKFEGDKPYTIPDGSGVGKSTLLGLLAGLDILASGKVPCNGKDISEEELPKHCRHNVSLAFQNYNLADYLTPLENPCLVSHRTDAGVLEKMRLEKEEINRNIMKLSGGQQQRVAISRALASDALIVLTDEPTGNLGEDTASDVADILKTTAYDKGKCVVVMTHNKQVIKAADVVLQLKNRELVARQRDSRVTFGIVRPRNPPASSVLAPLYRTTSWGTPPM